MRKVAAYVNEEDGLVCAKCYKPFKELTDEEIEQIFEDETGFVLDESPMALMDFARAILRKAQEK